MPDPERLPRDNDTSPNPATSLVLRLNYLLVLAFSLLIPVLAFLYLVIAMPGQSFSEELPPLSETAESIRRNLQTHVRQLAGDIGERNFSKPGRLHAAAAYIEEALEAMGYSVGTQAYGDVDPAFTNLVVQIPGADRKSQIVVVGAHYDTVAESPGADDNASGVAGLIEIARLLRDKPLSRTVHLVAFTNEEEPFSHSDLMGSVVYAKRAREKEEAVVGMLSLESLGYYSDKPGSQHYPPPFSWFYPDVASFIAFVGNLKSRDLVRQSIASFRKHAQFPAEGVAPPDSLVEDVRRSDHASFWAQGYSALMVTDTAPFRNPHYHKSSDTPNHVNFDHLTRVVMGLSNVVEDLANSP